DKVHGLESGWDNQRSQKNLTNNPGPKAVTGFKLDKGRAYRKLNEAWPVYEPLDSTKEGKGKDESSWKNSEKTTAENDAPLVGSTGSQMASSTSLGNVGDTTALTPLLRGATTTTVQLKQTDSNSQDQQKFQKYLNTAQALHQMGVIVPELSQGGWQSQTARHSSTRGLQSAGANRGASLAARTTTTVGVGRRDSTSTTLELPNVITQLYHTSTSQLAYLNGQIVVMGSNAVPSLWYWVVDERTTSGRATWWAKTHLNFGTEVQKNFVENQLGFKSEDNSNTSLTNFKSQGLTQPAYLISGLDVVADHLVFAAFKAGAVGYDMTTDSNASTYNQALTWSTTAGLDSDGGYNNLVTNTAGLNGPINGLFTLLDTFAYVTPVSGMKGGSKNNEEVQTTYPVKSDQKATAKIASLINASPLNSYGDNGDKKAIHLRWKADSSKIFLTIGKLTKAVSLM
ncbi:MgpC family cytadherence protein, partial [Mycoplasmoides pneumoniae]